jgi:replicative superfamily II helicase
MSDPPKTQNYVHVIPHWVPSLLREACLTLGEERQLKTFQKEAVARALVENNFTVVDAATGSGKTLIVVLLCVMQRILLANATHYETLQAEREAQ